MIKALFRKEFMDSIRDKRAVFAALAGALFSPLFFAGVMTVTIETSRSVDEMYIHINNAEQAPQIVELLEREKIYHVDTPKSGKSIVVDGEKQKHSMLTLTFDEAFQQDLAKSKPATVTINADYSEKATNNNVRRVKRVMQQYESSLVSMRLLARGISPGVAQVIDLDEQDTSTPSSKSALILGVLGVMILLAVFVSSTNVAIDCSAGERERNSLELLLMQPVNTFDVVVAKAMNTGLFGIIGGTLSLILTALVIPFIPLHKMGLAFNFDATLAISIWIVIFPLALFAAALQLTTAFKAKSFKEAQSYIQYTIMVPVIVPMALEFSSYKHELLNYLPIVAQQQVISQLIRGELTSYGPAIGGFVITLLATLGLVKYMAKSLKSEKVVLGL